MKIVVLFLLSSILLISCSTDNSNTKEVELKEKELALEEQETPLKEMSVNNQESLSTEEIKDVVYKSYTPCTFSISLPSNFKMQTMYDDESPDYCDYIVTTNDGFEVIELHSLFNSRFEFTEIEELYSAAVKNSELQITYKTQKANWFVISGTNKKNGNIIYWKRVSGESFISDLHIEYPATRKQQIEPYIGRIASSFKSE